MKLALALGILVAASSAFAQSLSQDLDLAHRNIRITDAKYVSIPTKTEIREIPGCNPHGEASQICTEEVVLESKPVVQVEVSYTDGVWMDPESANRGEAWTTFNFEVSSFSAEEVEFLKKNTSLWDFGGKTRNRRAFAAKHFELSTEVVTRTIQIVDVRNSRICWPNGESGEVDPTCQEVIVYKDAYVKVREVTVTKK